MLLALLLTACSEGNNGPVAPSAPPPVTPAVEPPKPPAPRGWTMSGTIVAAPANQPVPGATLLIDGFAPITSDALGNYSLTGEDVSVHRVAIAANGHLARETSLRAGSTRDVNFDLIPTNGSFPMTLFRQMGRNTWEQPNAPVPLKRWTTNPDIHIETVWRDTGAPVNNLDYFVAEIRRAVSLWSDQKLSVGNVVIDATRYDLVPGYISVQFDHSSTWSLLGANPGMVRFGGDSLCNSTAIVHEIGHAMGFWHNGLRGSVMGGGIVASCAPQNLTPEEQQVAHVLYSRPPGNVDPDKDPDESLVYLRPTTSSGVLIEEGAARR